MSTNERTQRTNGKKRTNGHVRSDGVWHFQHGWHDPKLVGRDISLSTRLQHLVRRIKSCGPDL